MVNLGVIGYGYWGPNLVRNFSTALETKVHTVADLDEGRLGLVKKLFPSIEVTKDYRTLLANKEIDAVVIATPVSSHFELAMKVLQANKHVFVEKPITETAEQAKRLIDEADRRGLILHVDHTFIYTGAVRKMRHLVETGELGDLYYYDSVRVNLGLFQPDVDVIWDLAVHDLSIMSYVFSSQPVAVSASGMSHVNGNPTNVAFLTIFFEDNAIAHLHVNWLAPVKVRRTLVGGSRKMIVYDDLEPSEKVKVYDRGITMDGDKEDVYRQRINYRMGDMWAPRLEVTEALQVEAEHFARCVVGKERSLSDGAAGLQVVKILEAATRSMRERGQPVALGWNERRKAA
jgi:predicted dehydrogenase